MSEGLEILAYKAQQGDAQRLRMFVAESNRIEGIQRPPADYELTAHAAFLALREVHLADMEGFVREIAAVPLRRHVGQDVRVGPHVPPPGGPGVERSLEALLIAVHNRELSPYEAHVEYETLHPFLDGNGRSGRALWAWMMKEDGHDPFALPFLHRWYYQSLDGRRA